MGPTMRFLTPSTSAFGLRGHREGRYAVGLLLMLAHAEVNSFVLISPSLRTAPNMLNRILPADGPPTHNTHHATAKSSGWGVADDWDALSSENPDNKVQDYEVPFDSIAAHAAREMELQNPNASNEIGEEDGWLTSTIDEIQAPVMPDDPPLYDTGFESYVTSQSFIDEMGKEISMLVRCNQSPELMLIEGGRALPKLTKDELNDVGQLVECDGGDCQATEFLASSVSAMFQEHSVEHEATGESILNAAGVAAWMTKALLSEKKGKVGAHDKRVLSTISKYGVYGSGYMLEHQFLQMYLETVLGHSNEYQHIANMDDVRRHVEFRTDLVEAVFRDIRNHGIRTPTQIERSQSEAEMRTTYGAATAEETKERSSVYDTMMDECEILDWDNHLEEAREVASSASSQRLASGAKSSHRLVHKVPNTNTPIYLNDGQFIFIDEESCIGCMQCASVSPNSFLMLESGRARTFRQQATPDVDQATQSCPVSCMHRVSYDELVEFETARDEGDGRSDHRHLGKAHIPVHVAMRDTDANHRTSWYHTLKHRCLMSSSCPQKGCYDCPKYENPGDNPFWKQRKRKSDHVRAQYFIENGHADFVRKTAEL